MDECVYEYFEDYFDRKIVDDKSVDEFFRVVAKDDDIQMMKEEFESLKKSITYLVGTCDIDIKTFYDKVIDLFNEPINYYKVMEGLCEIDRICGVLRTSISKYFSRFKYKDFNLYLAARYGIIYCDVLVKSLITDYC